MASSAPNPPGLDASAMSDSIMESSSALITARAILVFPDPVAPVTTPWAFTISETGTTIGVPQRVRPIVIFGSELRFKL